MFQLNQYGSTIQPIFGYRAAQGEESLTDASEVLVATDDVNLCEMDATSLSTNCAVPMKVRTSLNAIVSI